ncbi:MAG: hypothetical protein LBH41_02585 [Rickettsiales bacterium]|jgi:outer membrane protein assembly factor BamB|nr:hypothetical protein [Rickettsiales bacterium]
MISKNLSVLAYTNGFTMWHYKTGDTTEAVESEGYFSPAASIFNDGDMMFASAAGEDGIETLAYYIRARGGEIALRRRT